MTLSSDDRALANVESLIADECMDFSSTVIDLLPIGIYVCDGVGRIRRYNRAAARLWGRTPQMESEADRFCGAVTGCAASPPATRDSVKTLRWREGPLCYDDVRNARAPS